MIEKTCHLKVDLEKSKFILPLAMSRNRDFHHNLGRFRIHLRLLFSLVFECVNVQMSRCNCKTVGIEHSDTDRHTRHLHIHTHSYKSSLPLRYVYTNAVITNN